MEAGGSLMEHNRFFNKFGGDIQKIFSKCAKCKIYTLKTPFSGTLKMNNQYLTVARPQTHGDKEFVMETKLNWVQMAIGRSELEYDEGYELKDSQPVRS
jgi:hypothetical protein